MLMPIPSLTFLSKQADRNKNQQKQNRRPDQLKPGDHIYAWRRKMVSLYAHHGIYIGDDKVIHFTSDPSSSSSSLPSSSSKHDQCKKCQKLQKGLQQNSSVTLICLNCFLGGDELYVFLYSLPKDFDTSQLHGGTYTTEDSNPQKEVIDCANYLLSHGFGSYNLYTNNCETFAQYCKTGLVNVDMPGSGQIKSVPLKFLEAINPIPVPLPLGPMVDVGRKIKVPVEELRGRSPAEYASTI